MKIKHLILIIVTSLVSTHLTFAQGRLSKSTIIEASGGYSINGWNVSLGAEFITNSPEHSILLQANYINYKTYTPSFALPIDNINLSVNYMYSLCKVIHAPINIGLFGGVFGGYESFPTSINTITVQNQPSICFGFSAGFLFDIYLTKGLSVFVSPKIFYNLNAEAIKPLLFSANVGLRFSL